MIKTAEASQKDFLVQQLGFLIAIVKQHIRNYLDDIFVLIKVREYTHTMEYVNNS